MAKMRPTQLSILRALAFGERSGADIHRQLMQDMTSQNVYERLRRSKEQGLVDVRQMGKVKLYRLTDKGKEVVS